MAGIGFTLQNLLKNDSFISRIKAYSYSALISSGPWIYSLLSFLIISFFVTADIEMNKIFQVTVIYVFAFSQVISGIFQLIATRVIADYIYAGKFEMISAVYLNTITVLSPLLFIFGFLIFGSSKLDVAYAIISTMLFVLMGLIWIQLIILTACRDFGSISFKFAVGFMLSVLVSTIFGSKFGFIFYFLGFTSGILYIFVSLHNEILNEFGSESACPAIIKDLPKFKKYYILMGVGLFFNLGIWADKFIFWMAGSVPGALGAGHNICGFLYENSIYDRMNLVLVVILIPVMAVFTLTVETNFYVKFRNFYKSITEKESLDSINSNLEIMKTSMMKGTYSILKITVPMAFVIIVFSDAIMDVLKLPAEFQLNWSVFTIGSLIHSFFLLSMVFLMYFDFLREAFISVSVFLVSNILLNIFGLYFFGLKFMGFGYAAAVSIAFITSAYFLKIRMNRLLYHTFERERIPGEIIVDIRKGS